MPRPSMRVRRLVPSGSKLHQVLPRPIHGVGGRDLVATAPEFLAIERGEALLGILVVLEPAEPSSYTIDEVCCLGSVKVLSSPPG